MCGRYYIDVDDEELRKIINEIDKDVYPDYKAGEILPSDIAPIYVMGSKKIKLILARWGLPKQKRKGIIINARAETLTQKQMFKNLVNTNRCVIPASAFFEWKKDTLNSKAIDKYIFRKNDSLLFMAGLYNKVSIYENKQLSLFSSEHDVDIYFTIITREANPFVSQIHDRMPLILSKKEANNWLSGIDIDELVKNNNAVLMSEIVE